MVRQGKTAQKQTGFRGIYPMLFAFFDGDDRLSRKAMRRQVNAMVASRVHGLGACPSNELCVDGRVGA